MKKRRTSGRVKTYFGIPVPPWREEPIQASTTMVFVLRGKIPSKKNELVAVVDRKAAIDYLIGRKTITRAQAMHLLFKKTFAKVVNSKKYQEWEAGVVEIFKQQLYAQEAKLLNRGLIFPLARVSVKIKFYWKDKHRRDNSNKSEGIHDALVKANVIKDDSYTVMASTKAEAGEYSEEVTESLAVIYVTVPHAQQETL